MTITTLFAPLTSNAKPQAETVIPRLLNQSESPVAPEAAPETDHTLQLINPVTASAPQNRCNVIQANSYEIESILGKGGVATVYKATCCSQSKPIALKVLDQHAASDKSVRDGFKREFATIRRLRHPGIICSMDMGEMNGKFMMALELVQGETLEENLQRNKTISEVDAVELVTQVAETLDYLHEQRIVHRDLKPSNIMLTQNNRTKLFDFGGALDLDNADAESLDGLYGTLGYVSPEQAEARPNIDGRADIYGLGIVLYRALTGRKPFYGTRNQVLKSHIAETPPKPSKFSRISPDLEAIILKCIAKNPADRYQSGGELASALRNVALQPEPESLVQRAKQWLNLDNLRQRAMLAPCASLMTWTSAFFTATRRERLPWLDRHPSLT